VTLDDSAGPSRRETKRCPDCAEEVLAAARKCRFCGYRFDNRRPAPGSLLSELIPGLQQTQEATLDEILADWGTALEPGESVQWFRLADVDHSPGYLLVTSRRLVFFRQTGRKRHERTLEYPLGLLSEVRMSGRPLRRRLELRAGVLGHAVHAPGQRELDRLGNYLEEVVAGRRSP
jgi:hypothetical protein